MQLKNAAKQDQAQLFRNLLSRWFTAVSGTTNLDKLQAQFSEDIVQQVKTLDEALYSETQQSLDLNPLVNLLENWRKARQNTSKNSDSALPPLYPSN